MSAGTLAALALGPPSTPIYARVRLSSLESESSCVRRTLMMTSCAGCASPMSGA